MIPATTATCPAIQRRTMTMYKKYLADIQDGMSLYTFLDKYRNYGNQRTLTAIYYSIKYETMED